MNVFKCLCETLAKPQCLQSYGYASQEHCGVIRTRSGRGMNRKSQCNVLYTYAIVQSQIKFFTHYDWSCELTRTRWIKFDWLTYLTVLFCWIRLIGGNSLINRPSSDGAPYNPERPLVWEIVQDPDPPGPRNPRQLDGLKRDTHCSHCLQSRSVRKSWGRLSSGSSARGSPSPHCRERRPPPLSNKGRRVFESVWGRDCLASLGPAVPLLLKVLSGLDGGIKAALSK